MSAADSRVQFHDDDSQENSSSFLRRLAGFVLHHVWYLQKPVTLAVIAPPFAIKQLLAQAARPSTKRLHFRDLFANGRRYKIHEADNGFHVTTTNKVAWHYRRRTNSCSVLYGELTPAGETTTKLHLRVRFRLTYLLDIFWLPAFITSIIVFMPWHTALMTALIVALFGLSWIGHRSHALLEGLEMINFVEKALADYAPQEPAKLAESNIGVIYEQRQDFSEVWERFYEDHKDEESA